MPQPGVAEDFMCAKAELRELREKGMTTWRQGGAELRRVSVLEDRMGSQKVFFSGKSRVWLRANSGKERLRDEVNSSAKSKS